ncbi:MAG: 50S ribosomal protein L6 [Sulfuricurvum sp.]|uniref:50S ribosomal protein L6 n=1 Tax=Sulfuricurvum sp. TaxID=2025608 RepID=UPI0026152E63|nr:50S ribosomal protein L6 [Sulfuricurvum sp.]MDD2837567.1 50S ribosomal protein L6 [Sulfuricurvum sp.]MDD3596391.1 50S ribosomal protein L6 [Sulfuricurvum sp.]MDD4884101.1 50S ribosomal protein L6 [Sulfuricurvum sp.]
MSRIGKLPISIPSDVKVTVDGTVITFVKGSTTQVLDTRGNCGVKFEDNALTFSTNSDNRADRAFWGTYRALAANIVTGLTTGFEKKLEINGVGYRAAVNGNVLNLQLGFSHDINYDIPAGITMAVEKNVISIKGADKQQVGQLAAEIRSFRPPEPYKGKGVKYADETILRKAGKTSKK